MSLRARWRCLLERRRERRMAGHRLLRAFADAYPEATFLEIGAGDGVTADHLRPFIRSRPWNGIMVEPVPHVFQQLQRNYAGLDRVSLENVAIADHDGTLPFYHFAAATGGERERLPRQYDLVGSLSREMLLRQTGVPNREGRIVEAEVPCMSVASLLRKHGLGRLDLVVIDAEGHDAEILRQLDLGGEARPRLLVYEDVHLSQSDRAECERWLQELGYETMVEAFDTWCLDARPDDPLTGRWRELRGEGPAVSREDLDRWFAASSERG